MWVSNEFLHSSHRNYKSKKEAILLPCMQGPFNYFWNAHTICRIMLHLASLALEVCSSKHRMNDTTYSILITAGRQRGCRGPPFIMLDMRLGFYQTHFLLTGEFSEHIFDAFSNLLDIFIFYILLSVSKPTLETPGIGVHCPRHFGVKRVLSGS